MATQVKLRSGINTIVFLGLTEIQFSSLSWINADNISYIYEIAPNGQAYVVYIPGIELGAYSFKPSVDDTLSGYIIITKKDVLIDRSLFFPDSSVLPTEPATTIYYGTLVNRTVNTSIVTSSLTADNTNLYNKELVFTGGAKYPVFALLSSLPKRLHITDSSNFDITADFSIIPVVIGGQSYDVYVYTNRIYDNIRVKFNN